jgi:hypothetical protein
MHYDHSSAQAQVEGMGLRWDHVAAAQVDVEFFNLDLTQEQVTRLFVLYAHYTKENFNATRYSFVQRVGLAFHFLFKRRI